MLILALIGFHNVSRISQLGDSIDVILRENFRSVLACQEMKESLERMDSGALFVLLGDDRRGIEEIATNEARFGKALEIELNNITLPGEGEKAALLSKLFGEYRSSIDGMRDPAVGRESKRRTYFSVLLPLFRQIKDTADDILRMNQGNMIDSNARARKQAARMRNQMYLMLFSATFLGALFLFLTGKWILLPIRRLTRSANEIRQGNLDLVVPSGSRDEIGQLSEAFNEMAASLRVFRRTDQAKLLRVQRSTRQAFDSLPDAIAVIDPAGEVEISTESAREVFGLRPNVRIRDLGLPWMPDLFQDALTNGRPAQFEDSRAAVQRFVRNEEKFYRPMAVPILDSGKIPAGVILVLKDVTQQRQQDELKSGVISTVSHQLKTPLTSVRMAIHLMLDEKVGELSFKQEELLMAAREDADRLARIVDELLDIGRMESGKAQMDLRPVVPQEMVAEAVEPYRSAARDGGVSLSIDLPEDLPRVWVDPPRMAHVFANLLSNALKYTPPGGKITISAKADGEVVRFRVSDTGVGIPEKYLPRIFEQFFRVPDQGPGSGVGLGLAIVKEIVESHGGTVEVESREGTGSTFVFSLRKADYTHPEVKRT